MSRPRVALVGWRLGSELERVIEQGADRFDYVVVSMDLDERLRPLVEWHRMPLPKLNSFRVGWAEFCARGAVRLGRLHADLTHTVGPMPIVPNRVDLNTVTFCHAAFHEATVDHPLKGSASRIGWRLGQRFTLALERWWFQRAVGMLVGISEGSAEDLRRHYPGVEVAMVPRGMDLERFRPDPESRRRMRQEHSIGPDDVVALFVDQQHRPIKGLDIAIDAFARARRSEGGPDLLWVLGAGNESAMSLAERVGVGSRVRFLGYTSELERFYRAADIFVLPTVYEAFCRAAHEAAACGLPVVAPPVNGIRELVGEDEAGILVGRDSAEVAQSLIALSGDPGRRLRMGENGRRRVSSSGQENVAELILDLHDSLLSRPRPGTRA